MFLSLFSFIKSIVIGIRLFYKQSWHLENLQVEGLLLHSHLMNDLELQYSKKRVNYPLDC